MVTSVSTTRVLTELYIYNYLPMLDISAYAERCSVAVCHSHKFRAGSQMAETQQLVFDCQTLRTCSNDCLGSAVRGVITILLVLSKVT